MAAAFACLTAACGGSPDHVTIAEDSGAPPVDAAGDATAPGDDGGAPADAGGSPIAVIPTAELDLGAIDCGGSKSQIVSLRNDGARPLIVAASVQGSAFAVTPTALMIAAGASAALTVTAAVPASAAAGAALTGALRIATNDPASQAAVIPLGAVPTGATLAFASGSLASADFGDAAIGVRDADVTLTMKNVGTRAATFAFGAPSDPQFGVAALPSPAVLGPGESATLRASFTPTKLATSTASSLVTATGAVCGASVARVALSGRGSVGSVTGWPSAPLDFGAAACGGAAPPPRSFTLSNAGAVDVGITGVKLGPRGYTTSLAPGAKVPRGGALIVTVRAPAIPYPSEVPGDYADALTITTDLAGDAPHVVALTESALGAVLAFDTSAAPQFGNFGGVPVGATATQAVTVVNLGNTGSNVSLSATAPFDVSPAAFTLPGGDAARTAFVSFAPATLESRAGGLTMTGTALCKPAPARLPLSAIGQSGGVAISSASLAFRAPCGTSAAPQSFTITNTGNAPMTWVASLGRGADSPYIATPISQTVAPGDSTTVTVTPAPIPAVPGDITPAAFADVLTIATDVIGDSPHAVTLAETPIGAVLSFQPAALHYGDVSLGTTSPPLPFVVTNAGNRASPDAAIHLASDDVAFALDATDAVVAAGGTAAFSMTFSPGSATSSNGAAVSLTTSDPLCAPLPAPLAADGAGTVAKVVVDPPALDFGATSCGTAALPLAVQLTNPGTQNYTVTSATLARGVYFTVSMSPPGGVVPKANGGAVVLTVIPSPIPAVVPAVPDAATYSDALTITTDAPGDSPHVVPLAMSAEGVILRALDTQSWDFGAVVFGTTGYFSAAIRNDGNVKATLSLDGTTLGVFAMNTTLVAAQATTVLLGTLTPDGFGASYTDSGVLVVPPGTVLCQPLPDLTVSLSGEGTD